ncbi:hypothetical protein COL5a_000768 [Colletotrichum fioriniae]|uniref:uncharacterized protein n=1 Tax=Colletotrichum fioriniae TaxID=710243 RepID=UPI00230048C5|nr:uncharacterized protein COL516b_003598 [Colletotrichum fioriniae]KAJ0308329.1 hypothetical protein COL516b_003598 [Colletotrichum fioriniae]KAJ0334705.1 hypothetical protein COL5a_000768 [Colletotrichum fioriniae]KAJ3947354.1 hypothetical protein N0V96_003745 [Colletotrichum fioriniae]
MPWISTENKVRMLEYKIRMDLVQYAARGCPPLRLDDVKSYRPKDKDEGKDLVSKPTDDGHTIKVVRALGICQDLSAKYGDKPWIKIKDEEWRNLTYMLLDSTEHDETRWVRSAGFEEAWKDVPARD